MALKTASGMSGSAPRASEALGATTLTMAVWTACACTRSPGADVSCDSTRRTKAMHIMRDLLRHTEHFPLRILSRARRLLGNNFPGLPSHAREVLRRGVPGDERSGHAVLHKGRGGRRPSRSRRCGARTCHGRPPVRGRGLCRRDPVLQQAAVAHGPDSEATDGSAEGFAPVLVRAIKRREKNKKKENAFSQGSRGKMQGT